MRLNLGLDMGSISVNTVLMDNDKNIIENHYHYCHGKPFHVLLDVLEDILHRHPNDEIEIVAVTGTGGKLAAELVGGRFVNEIVAQSSAVRNLYPEAKTVIEMGGEDSKLIFMERNGDDAVSQLKDFAMNSICAAGTGSFLDQQANRIGVSIENEFGEMALKSDNPPQIAGRCSVFAKSDMIHLQQIATPVHDIVAGLCFAVARNFKSTLARGKELEKPVVFQGGVAANAGMVRAFREILGLEEGELIIPTYHASMGAIGGLYYLLDHGNDNGKDGSAASFKGLDGLKAHLAGDHVDVASMEMLTESEALYNKDLAFIPAGVGKYEVYLGIDVGSLSTNVVLIDKNGGVIARRYLPTASKPLDAIRRGMAEIYEEAGESVTVMGVGTTGSGRYLTGDFVGADTIQNEITAQATAAIAYDKTVDTIFEIGGQDSKYISIQNGVVVDFEMNKVCAAGTGSFLEEQAEKLDINIIEEFGSLSLAASKPSRLGDRCTVFMESDLNSHQQKGAQKESLVAGLAYSIVHNYIQKVVGDKYIGKRIFFQGGVANNKGVVAAFEKVTGQKITIPPHFDVTGAIGAAMIARDRVGASGQKTRFKGFEVSKIPFTLDKFTCKSCSNQCQIRRVRIEGEDKPLFYGGRCEKWEVDERKGKGKDIPNHFVERISLLMGDFKDDPDIALRSGKPTIGIPRALMVYYQQFPYWRAFFEDLGFAVVLSRPTDRKLVSKSLEMLTAETCFPVEVMHGHVHDLLEKGVDHVFLPFIFNVPAEPDNPTVNYNCPWVQTYPFMIKGALKDSDAGEKLLVPAIHLRYSRRVVADDLGKFMKEKFGISKGKVSAALVKAQGAQKSFELLCREKGREALSNLPEGKTAAVVIGRPYNTGDPELNLSLMEKLINLNVVPIPVDYLPLESVSIWKDYPSMYWPNGQKILKAARIVGGDPRLNAVYMSNFRCGPDSFLAHYIREELKGKPYLQLEVDEHSADAGMITRCEAFLDSLKGAQTQEKREEKTLKVHGMHAAADQERVLYFPYMRDGAYALAAASRSCGINAQVLPMQDEKDLEWGRKYTSSRECFPMICTTGSFIKKMMEPGFDPKKVSFFMPDHNGPCRFGQYNRFQRILFNRLGFEDVSIVSPSNTNSYADLSGGHGNRFRIAALRGIVAVDLLRKLQLESRPYEAVKGSANRLYREYLDAIVKSIEEGSASTADVLHQAALAFKALPKKNGTRKPVIAVVGEIFMRDNPFCSGFIVDKLEALGAEVLMSPFREWITYSTYRYWRDSVWKGDVKGLFKSKLQDLFTNILLHKLDRAVDGLADMDKEVELHEMLEYCAPYIHRDYDGDPALNLGNCVHLVEQGVSGIANILPFTCMPGTVVASLSAVFRDDHDNIPWVNIAYDGQEDTGIETRLQAFMHQAREYRERKELVQTPLAN